MQLDNLEQTPKNAKHCLTYSDEKYMQRMLEDLYDLFDALVEANNLVDVPKPKEVKDMLTKRKQWRSIVKNEGA